MKKPYISPRVSSFSAAGQMIATVGLAATLSACAMNRYTTPRTIPVGEVSHTVSVSMPVHPVSVPVPRYEARVGLSERVDAGFRPGLLGMDADLKYNFLRGPDLDMAIDPSVGYYYLYVPFGGQLNIFQSTLPLMIAFHPEKSASIYAHGGIQADYLHAIYGGGSANEWWILSASAGLGVQIRTSKDFAVSPEIGITIPFSRTIYQHSDRDYQQDFTLIAGIGFNLGAQPSYADVGTSK